MDRLHFIVCLCLLLLTAQASPAPELQVQQPPGAPSPSAFEVVGTSYIVPDGGDTITAYASTELGGDVSAYYEAEVDASLTEGGATVIPPETAYGYQGQPAEGIFSYPSGAALFELFSTHSLLPTYDELCDDTTPYADPLGFASIGGATGQGYVVVDAPQDETDESGCVANSVISVGSSFWQQYGGVPLIGGISPNGVTLNSSGTLTIAGTGLTADQTDLNPAVTVVSGTGLTLNPNVVVVNPSDPQSDLQVGYTVDGNGSSTGAHGITVTTIAGTSNQVNVNVGDPTPAITGVSPNPWNAGTTVPVTITGTGFGTNPSVGVSGAGVACTTTGNTCATTNPSDTSVSITVAIAANAPSQNATVTVTSNGYNGSSFLPAQTGQSAQAAYPVPVDGAPFVLQILFNGQNIANNGNVSCPGNVACVVVGQQIALTATITQGGNQIVPDSQQWSQPGGTVIANYVANQQSGTVVPLPNPSGAPGDCQSSLSQNCLTFYWVDQGNGRTVTYSSRIGGQPGPTATMTFNVAEPSGLQVTGSTGVPNIYYNATNGTTMGFVLLVNYGIQLTASMTNPQGAQGGSFSWVQILTAESTTIREGGPNSGTGVVGCIPLFFAKDPSPELDTRFPGPGSLSPTRLPSDSPLGPGYVGDVAGENRYTESFSTYPMWNPNLPGSILVPLGTVGWQWKCDAVNTLTPQSNGTTWTRACAAPQPPGGLAQFSPGASYPEWHSVASNGATVQSCQYQ